MNKYFLLIFISIFSLSFAQAQEYSFGIKGGGNYSMTGEIDGSTSGRGFFDGVVEGKPKVGFHAGVFFELNFGNWITLPVERWIRAQQSLRDGRGN